MPDYSSCFVSNFSEEKQTVSHYFTSNEAHFYAHLSRIIECCLISVHKRLIRNCYGAIFIFVYKKLFEVNIIRFVGFCYIIQVTRNAKLYNYTLREKSA